MQASDDIHGLLFESRGHAQLRAQLLKFATLQLGDAGQAEDVVQEAFIGAMQGAHKFQGKSAYKSWVFAILKNKIVDHLRKVQRFPELSEDDDSQALFDSRGHWYQDTAPSNWGQVEKSCESDDFWVVFEACLNHLPGQQGKVFMMREYLQLSSDEICAAEHIKNNNLHILLYRARLRLQSCLAVNWYDGSENDEM